MARPEDRIYAIKANGAMVLRWARPRTAATALGDGDGIGACDAPCEARHPNFPVQLVLLMTQMSKLIHGIRYDRFPAPPRPVNKDVKSD